jgi:hypothetical protein
MYNSGVYAIPDYQRDSDQWDMAKKSLFAESVLNNLTIPAFLLAPTKDGKYEVIDGQQRLTTLKEFHTNSLRLVASDEADYLGDRSAYYAGKTYRVARALRKMNCQFVVPIPNVNVKTIQFVMRNECEVNNLAKNRSKAPRRRKVIKKVIYPPSSEKEKKRSIRKLDDFHKKLVESTVRYQNDRIDVPRIGDFIGQDPDRRRERVEKIILERKHAGGAGKTVTLAEQR